MSPHHFIPGMRVEIRDAEWRIERVDITTDGGYLLSCMGLSELVRGRSALFLTALERDINVLDPASTELVDDLSDGYIASQLFLDTALRQTPPVDDRVHIGHKAALDLLPFQLDPALQALEQPRQRILISDAVGLGKTLEAGILVSELIRRGRGKRILVLAVKSMLAQFQQEFWQRFTIPLVRLDSVGLQRVYNQIPANHNPFHYFDRAIISIDTLKQKLEYRHYLEQAYWDIIIIDEAHNVARRSNRSLRYQLAELLSTRSDTLIMLSATPHDGKPESFASLMNMLDPTAIANPSDYQSEDFRDKGLVIRRFKGDIAAQLSKQFPEREISTEQIAASPEEEHAFSELIAARFHSLDGTRQSAGQLFRTTLEKALFSSPAACLSTIENRLARLRKREPSSEILADISTLEGLSLALRAIRPETFSKYQLLLDLLRPGRDRDLGWRAKDPRDRLVIFTESLETLKFLESHLPQDLKLKSIQVAVLRGTMRDSELMDTVDAFGQKDSPIRLLLCSDVAAEGINLHHLSHRMIHFDIPWSLMVFQQRNGRIDRYGQTFKPQIRYLMTLSEQPEVRGDQRILEILIEKDEQAGRNIGDPSEFLGVFSVEEEEAIVAQAMEQEPDPNADPNANQVDANDISALFGDILGDTAAVAESGLKPFVPERPVTQPTDLESAIARNGNLFPDDLSYAGAALNSLKQSGVDLTFQLDAERRQVDFTAPTDLRQRLKFLPRESRPKDDRFILSDRKDQIQDAIKAAREGEEFASPLQFLWSQHPVMEWLQDRVLDGFGRHTAPIIRIPRHLSEDEHWFAVQGGFPNKRGQALIQASIAVRVQAGQIAGESPLATLLDDLKLDGRKIPNPAVPGDVADLRAMLPAVVKHVRGSLKAQRDALQAARLEKLNRHLENLTTLRGKHLLQLELDLAQSDQPVVFKEKRKQDRSHHIERVFNEYRQWLEDTQRTEDDPYIQIIAVFTGRRA
jgi:hypothetical protein